MPPPATTLDLRRVVLDASIALVEEKGLASLSMREVARRAGVSHQAPYHHFVDREAILAEIAREGFDDLRARLAAAPAAEAPLRDRLVAKAYAYLAFARARPAHFRVMFRPELVDLSRFPACEEAGDCAFDELKKSVVDLLAPAAGGASPEGADVEVWSTMIWSMVHGLACLVLDGPLARKLPVGVPVEAMVDATLARFADVVLVATAGGHGASPGTLGASPRRAESETKKRAAKKPA